MAGIGADRNPAADGTGQQSGHTRIVFRQGICLLRFGGSSKPSPLQHRSNALADEERQAEDARIFWRGQLMKPGTATPVSGVNSIDHHRVKMHVCIQRIPKTLHECHGATLRGAKIQQSLGPPPQVSK